MQRNLKLTRHMHLVAQYLVYKEVFAIYPMSTYGTPWVSDFSMGHPWATYAKLNLSIMIIHQQLMKLINSVK
jgi:hypothetical protein